jgi:hypothetical protein
MGVSLATAAAKGHSWSRPIETGLQKKQQESQFVVRRCHYVHRGKLQTGGGKTIKMSHVNGRMTCGTLQMTTEPDDELPRRH